MNVLVISVADLPSATTLGWLVAAKRFADWASSLFLLSPLLGCGDRPHQTMTPDSNPTLSPGSPATAVWANRSVWLIALGRFLSQIGAGLIFFYIPLVFVNYLGLSATAVGLSVGLSSITGVGGHFLGGVLVDMPRFGRKTTLILSGILGVAVSLILAIAATLPLLIVASVLLGVGVGFYWTAADAALMDVTTPPERHQAFAIGNLANNLGNGVGILGGGVLLVLVNDNHQLLFIGCGLIYLVFVMIVQMTMPETYPPQSEAIGGGQGLGLALRDRALLVFIAANLLFTTYIALVNSTIPLYFTNFVPAIGQAQTSTSTATLFSWCYIGLGALLQIPVAYLLNGLPRVRILMVALLMWATGFCLVWVAGTNLNGQVAWSMLSLCWLALGAVIYVPFAAAIVAELAPPTLRGAYVAVSSQCWAIGYFVGPVLGGWAMDQTAAIAHQFWLWACLSTVFGFIILALFNHVYRARISTDPAAFFATACPTTDEAPADSPASLCKEPGH